ncbi:MAG: hypothetical protein RIR70_1276 [Pseudomonadota bacterium]|jgi:hypothetical protein
MPSQRITQPALELLPFSRPSHIAIDIASDHEREGLLPSFLDSAQRRFGRLTSSAEYRERTAQALRTLESVRLMTEALASPKLLPHLLHLHRAGVVNLNDLGWQRHNAISYLVDATPPALEDGGGEPRLGLAACLAQLTAAGFSIHGHRHAPLPPLALALLRGDDAALWVQALLDAGANPLQHITDRSVVPGTSGTKTQLSSLGLAAERGETALESLMVDALLPDGKTLNERDFIDLTAEAIKADSALLFARLERDHEAQFPGMMSRSLHQHGRQLGPHLAAHLLDTHARNHAVLSVHQRTLNGLQTLLPGARGQRLQLTSKNAALEVALCRSMEIDDPIRARLIRTLLHQCNSDQPPERAAHHRTACQDALTALSAWEAFDVQRFENALNLFGHLWANRNIEATISNRASNEVGESIKAKAYQMRRFLSDELKAIWGDAQYRKLILAQPHLGGGELESHDDALQRAGRVTLTTAKKAVAACKALRAGLDDNAAAQQLAHSATQCFNALLKTAIECGNLKAAQALLGETPTLNLRQGLQIQDPLPLLKKLGTLPAKSRAQVVAMICRHIVQDPHAPISAPRLLDSIDAALPVATNYSSRELSRLMATLGAMSAGVVGGALYWLATSATQLASLREYETLHSELGMAEPVMAAFDDYLNRYHAVPNADMLQPLAFQTGAAGMLAAISAGTGIFQVASCALLKSKLDQREAYRAELIAHLSPQASDPAALNP